jgi:hypothetical protein
MGGWNQIIAELYPREIERWGDKLSLVDLSSGDVLITPDCSFDYVYFPIDCIISVSDIASETTQDFFTLIGNEGMVGASVFLGDADNVFKVTVEVGGKAYRLPVDIAINRIYHSEVLRVFMLRYMQALVFSAMQTAVCDHQHTLLQQTAKALLLFDDRLLGIRGILSQALLAKTIGVSSSQLNNVLSEFVGVRSSPDGLVSMANRWELEHKCCECYVAIKNTFSRLLYS